MIQVIQKDKLEQETINILLEEQFLLEFTKISKNYYKTPVGLWVDEAGNKRQNEHGESPKITTAEMFRLLDKNIK